MLTNPETFIYCKQPSKQTQRAPKPAPTVTLTSPTLKKEKERVPLKSRPQAQRPIGSRGGKITGTDIPFKKGKCNNWQVWSYCAMLQSPAGCKWEHICSNCNSHLHGATDCPYK